VPVLHATGHQVGEVSETLCKGIVAGGFFIAWDEKRGERVEVNKPPALATAGPAEPLPGLINLTPGYTPTKPAPVGQQVVDGENLRRGRNNRLPG
jgi:hypothetical protein